MAASRGAVFEARISQVADDLQTFALGNVPLSDPGAMQLLRMSYDAWDWSFGRGSAVPGRALAVVKARIEAASAAAEAKGSD